MATSQAVVARDDAIWSALDVEPHLSARDLADHMEISTSLTHAALKRLETSGMVRRDDLKAYPYTWIAVGAPDDDMGSVIITEQDAWLVLHLLRYLATTDQVGQATVDMIERIEAAID